MLIFADFIVCNKQGNYGKDGKTYALGAHFGSCSSN